MLKMMVLDKNDSWGTHIGKIYEESAELIEAIAEGDHVHMVEEALDNIQVALGVLDKLQQEGIDIQQAVYRHNKKLIHRGWGIKASVNIEIKKR